MSKRSEIIDGQLAQNRPTGLIYTEIAGWVDLRQARGTDINYLLNEMAQGEASVKDFYDVGYSQRMTSPLGSSA